jgi:hypothetical protein
VKKIFYGNNIAKNMPIFSYGLNILLWIKYGLNKFIKNINGLYKKKEKLNGKEKIMQGIDSFLSFLLRSHLRK